MSKIKLRFFTLARATSLAAFGTILPLVITACGDLESTLAPTNAPSVAAQTFLVDKVQPQVVVQPESVPSKLVWPSIPPLPADLAEEFEPLSFSTNDYPSAREALLDLSINRWQISLPTTAPTTFAERHLWVRLIHNRDPFRSVALDLTVSSQILQVSADLRSELTTFFTNVFAPQIVVDADNSFSNALQWRYALPPLPQLLAGDYFAPEFSFAGASMPTSNAVWSAGLPISFINPSDHLWVRFRHQRLASRTQLLAVPIATQLSNVMLARELIEAQAALATLTFSSEPSAAPGKTNQLIAKHLVVARPVGLLPTNWQKYYALAFSTFNFASASAAQSDTTTSRWQSALPTATDLRPAMRFLWARFTPRKATSLALPVVAQDLRETSGLSSLQATADDYGEVLDAYISELFGLRYLPSSTARQVVWDPATLRPFLALPAEVAEEYEPIKYDVKTLEGVVQLSTIPTTFSAAPSERFLRLSITPRRGSKYRQIFPLDLTTITKLQALPA